MVRRLAFLAIIGLFVWNSIALFAPLPPARAAEPTPDRSPVDLLLTPDEQFLLTANQTSNTVSLVRVSDGQVTAEVPIGARPTALALSSDGQTVLATATFAGDVVFLRRTGDKLERTGSLHLSWEPRGVVLSPDNKLAYVALTTASAVAVVDVATRKEVSRIETGKWPRYLAITPDGQRLAVGVNGSGGVAVIDTQTRKELFTEDFLGLNLGQMQITADGKHVYFPWIVYRANPITPFNIRIGWVLASRVARVRLDQKARREALALDPQGMAVSDPHGLALSPDEQQVAVAASGTHELLLMTVPGLPLIDFGGTDHIDPKLLADKERFTRIPLGGRPMAVRYSKDGQRIFVANYLLNAVQVVDAKQRKIVRTLVLGGAAEPSLARQGEAIFFDGKRSLDQWYSCHSCHYEGHTNAVTMDTRNDGSDRTFKTILSLRNVVHTGPWTWHGWQKDLDLAMRKSLTDSMLGPKPSEGDVKALIAFLGTLTPPPNPHRLADGGLSPAAQRGEKVYRSTKAQCARCHGGTHFTDGKIHDVGTGDRRDAYNGYNPPSLIGVYDRMKYLHDGRAKTLAEVFTGAHDPDELNHNGKLSADELNDLVEYLKALQHRKEQSMAGTHEHLEHAEHAQHAAHDPFDKRIAVSMAIIAALLAMVTLGGHRAHNQTILYQAQANIYHTEATDQWAFYQAKNIRNHQYQACIKLIPTLTLSKEDQAKALMADWQKQVDKYEGKDLPEIKAKAEDLTRKGKEAQVKSHIVHKKADFLDVAELFVEVGLVVCSIALLTKSKSYWYAGVGSAALGATIALYSQFATFTDDHHDDHDHHPKPTAPASPGEKPAKDAHAPKADGHQPMAQRIAALALVVRDYDEAIAYYTQVLGFTLSEDTDLGAGKRWVRVTPPGSAGPDLLLARAANAEQASRVGNQTGGRVFLFLHTDDFWRDYHAYAAKGVIFDSAPRTEAYGSVVVFTDMYGNRWDLIGPTSFTG